MKQLALSGRLAAVAAFVPRGARVIDVGTDHAYIPIWLAQQGRAAYLLASDLRPGPLARARADAADYGVADKIDFQLNDGLDNCPSEAVDTIIIAGMGGETMIHILESAPWTRRNKLLILQPMSKVSDLRSWLIHNGYRITQEDLVREGRCFYPIFTAAGGAETHTYTTGALLAGHPDLLAGHSLYSLYLSELLAKARRVQKGLNASAKPSDAARLRQVQDLCMDLERIKERIYGNGSGDC